MGLIRAYTSKSHGKKKLPVPTRAYPMKATKKTVSWPYFRQLRMPLLARYMNNRFVRVLMISAA